MNYKNILTTLRISGIGLSIFGILSFICIIFNPAYFKFSLQIDTELAEKFGVFFGGFIGTIFTIVAAILILYTFINQKLETKRQQAENHFFKMLDYHNDNVKNLSVSHVDQTKKNEISNGRRAFTIFKLQLIELLKFVEIINKELNLNLAESDIIDIAYISFYYGIDRKWESFSIKKLSKYPRSKEIADKLLTEKERLYGSYRIGRTNQTSLSSYYRNMYRAIKYIDSKDIFTKDEKENYIKIFRAQLSNSELYVLFFNVVSRFGKKWIDNKYITRYEFIKNIPNNFCDPYDHKKIFPMNYEEDEIN